MAFPIRLLMFILLHNVLILIIGGPVLTLADIVDSKVMTVGVELWQENLSLKMASRLYELHALKSQTWYEVKISYPASIPASFSLELKKGKFLLGRNSNRRLLNTEKLIFKTDTDEELISQGGLYVLVTVEPEGVVAIPHTQEREFITFNIVCDELLLGIPHEAWWVAVFGVICLVLAFIVPRFLPSYLLLINGSSKKS
ncbi:hypothetical protein ACFE04_015799 [Oxalis oulophora]